ncbi:MULTISPECIES: class I SAM-dependent methyltransferase [unclassified Corynebacterium]|uniref:class I SAM-dependent methyltransferase n=1 Tax=unclassified Corynebacterium TaxID=2624378 RepID=UPI002169A482|nr:MULTISPECIES: class I SAM-dependent methyltransferase [unclassified Corynebacterium]MCS4490716.1 methyltransferase domain-containing protein [Corynebacterium sp. ES2775-CONJ]MCS4492518.1 methyltransferase domain-containing protein [Corynebacterium sp. ES2715-CONJ3]MCS4532619.1 methyltransferase domain-containing protein [Corynebacterium sp. ES2730-CONJ]
MSSDNSPSRRPTATAAGHWILARAGKKVLRPGGRELTTRILKQVDFDGRDVVEFAPGLGHTARLILAYAVASYTGVEQDSFAAAQLRQHIGSDTQKVLNASADTSGLADLSADIVIGEAMLTMQGNNAKQEIIHEAHRLLRPGGHYLIHELSLTPDDIGPDRAQSLQRDLAQAIRVNARPLTQPEWTKILEAQGFKVIWCGHAPMALLSPSRLLADEGLLGTLKIVGNIVKDRDLRARILHMRSTFKDYEDNLAAIGIVAQKREE